jgi:hypothetical protein
MKRFIPLAVFLLVLTYPSISLSQRDIHGTAIFAVRTPNEIAVAADSRAIGANGLPTLTPVCKIRQIENIFLVAYGLYEESQSGYNLWKIIERVGKGFNTVSSMAHSFETYMRSPLEKALQQIRVTNPEFYKEKCMKRPPVGVIFFGIEDDALVFRHRKVTVYDPASANIWIDMIKEDCPGAGCLDGSMAIAVAEDQEMDALSRLKLNFNSDLNLVELAKIFVADAISKNPIKYGPPIDIVRLNKSQTQWIQRKSECAQRD